MSTNNQKLSHKIKPLQYREIVTHIKKQNTAKSTRKYIKYEKITERQQHKNNHTRLRDQRSGRWRRSGMP
jgi:hypothetical protein